jgi:hypothetical protein
MVGCIFIPVETKQTLTTWVLTWRSITLQHNHVSVAKIGVLLRRHCATACAMTKDRIGIT